MKKTIPNAMAILCLFLSGYSFGDDDLYTDLKIQDLNIAEYLATVYEGDFARLKEIEKPSKAGFIGGFRTIHQNYLLGYSESHGNCLPESSVSYTISQGATVNKVSMKEKFADKFEEYFNQGFQGPLVIHALAKVSHHYQVMKFVDRHACNSPILKQFEENLHKYSLYR